jgi:hypothetical protein
MMVTYEQSPIPASRWTVRLAVFGATLVLTGLALHRLAGMSTSIALTLFAIAFAVAGLALLVGLLSSALLWRYGGIGTTRTFIGLFVSASIFAWPASYLPSYFALPLLNDVTTDLRVPPRFVALARVRGSDGSYPAARFAALQQQGYSDLQSFVLDRSVDEAYELSLDVVRRNRMEIVAQDAPGGALGQVGVIEAIDRTLIMGFPDDVLVRVSASGRSSRIDVRSASRYGQHDFGRNAQRIRRFLKDLQQRLETTLPGDPLVRPDRRRGREAVPKRGQAGDRTPGGPQSAQGRAPKGAQRGPEQKASPPSKGAGPARDKARQPQFQ